MSTTSATTPMRRRSALGWELRKARGWWFPVLSVLITVLGCALGADQYRRYLDEFQAQGVTWLAVWGQATMLPTMFFLPLAIGSLLAQVTSNEREGRNWQRMQACGVDSRVFVGKVLHCLYLAVVTCGIFWVGFLVTGLSLGFRLADVTPILTRILPMVLAAWAIALAAWWLGEFCSSFATTMTIFLLATLAGTVVVLVAPAIAPAYPLSLLTAACGPRQLESVGAWGPALSISLFATVWAVVFTLLARRQVRRH